MDKNDESVNKGKWLIYFVIAIIILIFLAFIFNESQNNQEIIYKGNNIYHFATGGFSTYFPEQPTLRAGSGNASEYLLDDSTGAVKLEAIYASSPYKQNVTMEENLNNLGVYAGDATGFTTTSSKVITYDGLPGIDYVSYNKSKNYYGVGRDIVKGNNLYVVEYFYPKGGEDKQLENTFLNSLTVDDTNEQVSNNSSASQAQATPVETPSQPQPTSQPQKKGLPAVIAEWSPNVALVVCTYPDGSGDFGSGFLRNDPSLGIEVTTNKHVFTEEITGNTATSCSIQIPGDSGYYTVTNTDNGTSGTFGSSINNSDSGTIKVAMGDSYFNNIADSSSNLTICQQQEQTGDNVVILGYPDYAGQFTEPTATTGIISGYASPYYTTSAQIESGNSGGIAIDPDKDCYIGIPSAVKIGNYANLGRILDANVLFNLPY
jgi:hypothetical protein